MEYGMYAALLTAHLINIICFVFVHLRFLRNLNYYFFILITFTLCPTSRIPILTFPPLTIVLLFFPSYY